ncbi:MAG: hypothetical protein WBD61_01215, partial [Desulfobulbales bacterium]
QKDWLPFLIRFWASKNEHRERRKIKVTRYNSSRLPAKHCLDHQLKLRFTVIINDNYELSG